MKKRSNVSIMTGGGGPALSVQLGVEDTLASSRGANVVNDVAIQATEWHPRLVEHDFLTSNQLAAGLTAGGLPRSRWSLAMTPTESVLQLDPIKNAAFTMAEILLSLTIIGVVAAITLPSLTGNINERTWNTQRKALYARFSQAIALMPALNGYGTLTEDSSGSVIEDTAAETFVTNGLAKVLKINNICDSEHLPDCGLPDKVTTLYGSIAFSAFPKTLVDFNNIFNTSWTSSGSWHSYSQVNTKTAAFETQNGESIAVFYNPNCRNDMQKGSEFAQPLMCANFVYDLNGTKGPNTMGKDIGFITVFYPSDSAVVAPMPLSVNDSQAVWSDASALCRQRDENSRLPNKDELLAMALNKMLFSSSVDIDSRIYWSGSVESAEMAWGQHFDTGYRTTYPRANAYYIWCVKR